jgi:hypothetical protein
MYRSPAIAHEEGFMTDRTSTDYVSGAERSPNGFAIGVITFAAAIMMMAGGFQALAGIVALFENKFYATTPSYTFEFDATAWGWIHLVVGIAIAVAGFGVLFGNIVARIVGIGLAALSAVTNFLFIPYYPFWSLAIIALDVAIIWALVAHGHEATD